MSRISRAFLFIKRRDFLSLDAITLRHLEILEPLHRDAPRNVSLRRAESHRHADGRASSARLAFATAVRRRARFNNARRWCKRLIENLWRWKISRANSPKFAIWNGRLGESALALETPAICSP